MAWLLLLHVIGNLIWIGSIASVGLVLATAPEPKLGGQIALAIYRRVSVPGFVLSFVAAVTLLALNTDLYLVKTHWMHAKLPLALGVIALHHVIGARAKRVADGRQSTPGPAGTLTVVLVVLAVVAAYLGLMKPM